MAYLKSNPEYETKLLNELPKDLKSIFQEKLTRLAGDYWKVLSEVRAVVIFFKKLGTSPNGIKDIGVKTLKNKDVDFVVDFEGEKIYIEVKGFDPDKETAGEYSSFAIDTGDDDIGRALRRADGKLLENSHNIIVISSEDTLHPLGNKNRQDLEGIFEVNDYKKVGAFIIFGPLREEDPFEPSDFLSGPAFCFTSITYNPYAQKQLPQNFKDILERNFC